MNYLQPDRLDALARAHALGTLSPRATNRFARIVANSATAAEAVGHWREMLATLEEGAPHSPPPRPRVWEGVQARLFERDERKGRLPGFVGTAPVGSGLRLGWLGIPLGILAGALLLWTQVARHPQSFGMESATAAAPASYVGVLQDQEGRALLATAARRQGNVLTIRVLRPIPVTPGHSLVIWGWSDDDPVPRRLGSWSSPAPTALITLPSSAESTLGAFSHLGLSSEASSTSPASPSQPFIAAGPCAEIS